MSLSLRFSRRTRNTPLPGAILPITHQLFNDVIHRGRSYNVDVDPETFCELKRLNETSVVFFLVNVQNDGDVLRGLFRLDSRPELDVRPSGDGCLATVRVARLETLMDLPVTALRRIRPDVFSSETTYFSDLDEGQVQTILNAMQSAAPAERRSNSPRIAGWPTIDARPTGVLLNSRQMASSFGVDAASVSRVQEKGGQAGYTSPSHQMPTRPEKRINVPMKADANVQTMEDPRLVELRSQNAALLNANAELKSQLMEKEAKFESMKTEAQRIRVALFRYFHADSSVTGDASNDAADRQTSQASVHSAHPPVPRTRSCDSVQNPPSVPQNSIEKPPSPVAPCTQLPQWPSSAQPETDHVAPLPPIRTRCVVSDRPNASSAYSAKDESDLSHVTSHPRSPPPPLTWFDMHSDWDKKLPPSQLENSPPPVTVALPPLPPPIFGCVSPSADQRTAPVAVSMDQMAIVGGLIEGKEAPTIDVFDVGMQSWHHVLSFPTGVSFLWGGAALIQEHLFLIGGINGSMPIDLVRHYSFQSKEWDLLSPMPVCRTGVVSAELNGKIYLTGETYQIKDIAEIYSPDIDRWSNQMPTCEVRCQHGMAADKDRNAVYVFGGRTQHRKYATTVEQYDPRQGSWLNVGQLPMPRESVFGLCNAERLFIMGGATLMQKGASGIVDVFDLRAQRWTEGPSMIHARKEGASLMLDEDIYVVGGFDGDKNPQEMEKWWPGGQWEAGLTDGTVDARCLHRVLKIPSRFTE